MSHVSLDRLSELSREQFTNSYCVSVELNGEQVFLKDYDNISRASADSVFQQFKSITLDSEPAGTLIRMFTIGGEVASFTVPA